VIRPGKKEGSGLVRQCRRSPQFYRVKHKSAHPESVVRILCRNEF
jgi:hypothetical protein